MTDITDKTVSAFLKRYLAEVEAGNAAIFAGAGLSAPAGYVDWRELLREIADELDLRIDLENDLISIAQFHLNIKKSRFRLNQAIIDKLSADNDPTINHRILSRLPINTWWTTNYDQLIERALIHVQNLKDSDQKQCTKGSDPFAGLTVNGEKVVGKVYDPPYSTSTYVYDHIKNNVEDWVKTAIDARK